MTEAIIKALAKLQAVTSYDDPKLNFMKKYTYDLGMNDLLKYGADQYVIVVKFSRPRTFTSLSWSHRSHALGVETFKRYRNLLSENGDTPFVRSAGSERVVLSARNWTLGRFLLDLSNREQYVD